MLIKSTLICCLLVVVVFVCLCDCFVFFAVVLEMTVMFLFLFLSCTLLHPRIWCWRNGWGYLFRAAFWTKISGFVVFLRSGLWLYGHSTSTAVYQLLWISSRSITELFPLYSLFQPVSVSCPRRQLSWRPWGQLRFCLGQFGRLSQDEACRRPLSWLVRFVLLLLSDLNVCFRCSSKNVFLFACSVTHISYIEQESSLCDIVIIMLH